MTLKDILMAYNRKLRDSHVWLPPEFFQFCHAKNGLLILYRNRNLQINKTTINNEFSQ